MERPDQQQSEFARFLRTEAWGGGVLVAATVIALILANSPLRDGYYDLLHWHVGPARLHLDLSLGHWIRDGLLTIFFFVVGLELKRELAIGELSTRQSALMPVAAAAGGVVVPVAIALVIMQGAPGADRAWAVPMATDIAFALGVLTIVRGRLSDNARTLLLGLAVADDLIAVAVIALLFSDGIAPLPLLVVAALTVLWFALQRSTRVPGWCFVPIGIAAWVAMHESGVHATIAGVLLGLATRVHPRGGEREAPALRWEHAWQPWSAGLVVPLFAFAAAGVAVDGDALRDVWTSSIGLGIVIALVLGKPLGIVAAIAITERFGVARRPEGVTWPMVVVVGALSGIGFTVALLVAELALPTGVIDTAKGAVLVASALATIVGVVAARFVVADQRSA